MAGDAGRPLRAWEALARGVDEGEAGALGNHWRPPGGHAGGGNAVPSRHPPSVNGRAGREGTRWEEKMGSLVISGEKDCCVRRWSLGEEVFFSSAPPSSTCAQAEGITGAASQPAPTTNAQRMPSTRAWDGDGDGHLGRLLFPFQPVAQDDTEMVTSRHAGHGSVIYSSSQLALSQSRFPSFVSPFSIPLSPRILQPPSPLDPFPSLPPDLDPTCALLIARPRPFHKANTTHNP